MDNATGGCTDMREHGWERDAWPEVHREVMASDILALAGRSVSAKNPA